MMWILRTLYEDMSVTRAPFVHINYYRYPPSRSNASHVKQFDLSYYYDVLLQSSVPIQVNEIRRFLEGL